MEAVLIFAAFFLLSGLLIALFNWSNFIIWVWGKYRNPRSRAEMSIIPFLCGLLLYADILAIGMP